MVGGLEVDRTPGSGSEGVHRIQTLGEDWTGQLKVGVSGGRGKREDQLHPMK